VAKRDDRMHDPVGGTGRGQPAGRHSGDDDNYEPRRLETPYRAITLLDKILQQLPGDDPKLVQYLLLLRHQLEVDEQQFEEARKLLQEYEEAYQKLTSPANRVGTYLGALDEGVASVAIGDTEFVANVDPKMDASTLEAGSRVKLNDAYAIVGELEPWSQGPIVKVAEMLAEGRLRVSMDATGQTARAVGRAACLAEMPIKVGDEVRMEPNFRLALEHFPQKDVRDYYLEEVPEIPWEKVGGQEEAIRLIRETIEMPLLYPELYARFSKRPLKGILLYGPPGCGKTLIGKATAHNLTREYAGRQGREVKEYFMYISGPKILNMWLGESERMVREIFAQAREKAREGFLVFLFIDEAESLLRTRSSGRYLNIANTVVPQFAAEMDGLVSLQNVVVLLTSNRPDYIDPAILRPERIDRKVKVGRPDRRASRDIFSIYLDPTVPLDPQAVAGHGGEEAARQALIEGANQFLFRRGEETEFLEVHLRNGNVERLYWKDLLSGALITSVVERAKDMAIRRAIEAQDFSHGVSLDDLQRAIRLEYRENEIFPKSDVQEDWLKLIDYEPENVASLRPIRPDKHPKRARRGVV
jgi:proteasome-associated ATPase